MHNAESADRRMLLGTVAGAAGIAALAAMSKAGPISPPAGTVASTGKTLASVEPRIDLNASVGSSGVTTNASEEFIISSPGSYYLSANITTSKADAVLINAPDVTLDLNGFKISRASGSGGGGVVVGADGATVQNGSIVGFASGVTVASGSTPRGCIVRNVRARNCGSIGIDAGESSVIESCTAINCGFGISARKGSTVARCTVETVTNGGGILTDIACTLIGCTVSGGGTSSSGAGITTSYGCVLDSCTVYGYTGSAGISAGRGCALSNCSAIQNNVTFGIKIDDYSSATNCVASANIASAAPVLAGGLLATFNCVLERCTASQNTGTASSNGVYCDAGCTLSGCTANSNSGNGFRVSGATVIGCTAFGNTYNGLLSTDRSSFIDCLAKSNGGNGFYSSAGSVQRCVASLNGGDGIFIDSNGDICGNSCDTNGASSTLQGAGIRTQGSFVRIRDNHCFGNWRNIDVRGFAGVVVTGNFCGSAASGANYSIAAGNKVGLIVASPASGAINGNTGGAGLGSTDPTSNFSY